MNATDGSESAPYDWGRLHPRPYPRNVSWEQHTDPNEAYERYLSDCDPWSPRDHSTA